MWRQLCVWLVDGREVFYEALMKDLSMLQHHISRSGLVQQRCLQDEEHYRSVREAIGEDGTLAAAAGGGGSLCLYSRVS